MKVMNPRLSAVARRLDVFWPLLAWPSRFVRRDADASVASILVIDLHLVGDIVMLIPLLQALRARYPAARITLLAGPWAQSILSGAAVVDEIICYVAPWVKPQNRLRGVVDYLLKAHDLHSKRWDVGIDVRGDVRQILLLYLAGCRRRVGFDFTGGRALLTDVVPDDGTVRHVYDHHQRIAASLDAWQGQEFRPALTLTPDEQQQAERIAPYIGFHLGASLPLRRLPPCEAAALLALHANVDGQLVLFSAADLEEYVDEVVSLLPAGLVARLEIWRGTLREFIVKASRAERMFAMDSGPAHIAAALGRETIVFFGPNLPNNTGPRGPSVAFVEDCTVPCRPCDQRHCTNPVHQACMRGLVSAWSDRASPVAPFASAVQIVR